MSPEVPRSWLANGMVQVLLFALTMLYCISPLDFIPDVLPLIGWLDDLGVFLLQVIAFLKYLKHRREAASTSTPPAS
jgi:uncharacterized membrane protein YkvA (DUF1232 family)